MERNRLLMIGAGLATAVVIILGFVIGVSPQLRAAADARTQDASVTAQNEVLRSGLVALKVKDSKMKSLTTQLTELQSSVPTDADAPAFIDEIYAMAQKSGVSIASYGMSDAQAYVAPAPAADSSSTANATAGVAPSAPVPVTNAAITSANFSIIPVTINVGGTYAQALDFLAALHNGDRMMLVTSFAGGAESSADGTAGSWVVTGSIYALADANSVQETQQSTTSTAADAASASSSTDTAAGK